MWQAKHEVTVSDLIVIAVVSGLIVSVLTLVVTQVI